MNNTEHEVGDWRKVRLENVSYDIYVTMNPVDHH
jgi:hypothetical protein